MKKLLATWIYNRSVSPMTIEEFCEEVYQKPDDTMYNYYESDQYKHKMKEKEGFINIAVSTMSGWELLKQLIRTGV